MKFRIYSHSACLGNDISVTEEQANLLESIGILDAADQVNMFLHYNEEPFLWLKERWKDRPNVRFKLFDENYKDWYEYTSCMEIQKDCEESEEEFAFLYMHTKGNFTRTVGNQNWRLYMQYWNVEKWQQCLQKFDEGYDTVGASWQKGECKKPYYAGNFFWAKSSYIRRCQKLIAPPEVEFKPQFEGQPHLRYDLEIWHGSGKPNAYDMDKNSKYHCWYQPPQSYREDMKDFFVYSTNNL